MVKSFLGQARLLAFSLSAATMQALPVTAYPIDCAIVLCLPGGFPASAECSAAKAEVIRRITPWPIEPPLQLWNCPMNAGASLPGIDADGLTPEVRQYRAGIEVWYISKRSHGGSGGRESTVTVSRQFYDQAGEYVRQGIERDEIPEWIHAAVSGLRPNDHFGRLNGLLFKFDDYNGASSTEWFAY